MKLTREEYWNHGYTSRLSAAPARVGGRSRLKQLIWGCLGPERRAKYTQPYGDYHFWNVLLKQFVPFRTDAKVLEIGSAPGDNLVEFHRRFGYVPFGVEYTGAGVELNRRTFAGHNLDPENVIHSDLFADSFQTRYANSFEAVISRGFIEHFTDLDLVVDKHVNLLTPGGLLIITIPNLRGLNYIPGWLLGRHLYPIHNLEVMKLRRFRRLMMRPDLNPLFCGPQGRAGLSVFFVDPDSEWKRTALSAAKKIQVLLNLLLQSPAGRCWIENRLTSPNFVYVGRKQCPPLKNR